MYSWEQGICLFLWQQWYKHNINFSALITIKVILVHSFSVSFSRFHSHSDLRCAQNIQLQEIDVLLRLTRLMIISLFRFHCVCSATTFGLFHTHSIKTNCKRVYFCVPFYLGRGHDDMPCINVYMVGLDEWVATTTRKNTRFDRMNERIGVRE